MNQQVEPFIEDAQQREAFAQVHVSRPHESAHLHVSGRACAFDDSPSAACSVPATTGMSSV